MRCSGPVAAGWDRRRHGPGAVPRCPGGVWRRRDCRCRCRKRHVGQWAQPTDDLVCVGIGVSPAGLRFHDWAAAVSAGHRRTRVVRPPDWGRITGRRGHGVAHRGRHKTSPVHRSRTCTASIDRATAVSPPYGTTVRTGCASGIELVSTIDIPRTTSLAVAKRALEESG